MLPNLSRLPVGGSAAREEEDEYVAVVGGCAPNRDAACYDKWFFDTFDEYSARAPLIKYPERTIVLIATGAAVLELRLIKLLFTTSSSGPPRSIHMIDPGYPEELAKGVVDTFARELRSQSIAGTGHAAGEVFYHTGDDAYANAKEALRARGETPVLLSALNPGGNDQTLEQEIEFLASLNESTPYFKSVVNNVAGVVPSRANVANELKRLLTRKIVLARLAK